MSKAENHKFSAFSIITTFVKESPEIGPEITAEA